MTIRTGSISGNKECAGLWPARALFKYSIEADSSLDCTLTANWPCMTTFPLTVVGIYHQWCHFFRTTIIELAMTCTSASVYQSTSTVTQLYQMRKWGGGKNNLDVTLFHGPPTEMLHLSGAQIWCHLCYLKAGRGALCWREAKNPIYIHTYQR